MNINYFCLGLVISMTIGLINIPSMLGSLMFLGKYKEERDISWYGLFIFIEIYLIIYLYALWRVINLLLI